MTQLSFSIRTTASCKTVHLVGSWDGYAGQLPLSKASGSKKDAWAGTFRFNASVIRDGERYWYYFVIDGYHVAHDPACDSMVEPKTSRRLNLLVVKDGVAVRTKAASASAGGKVSTFTKAPAAIKKSSSSSKESSDKTSAAAAATSTFTARRHARHGSVEVPRGRPVSPSQIKAPQPFKPASVVSPQTMSAVSPAQVSEHGSTTVAHLAAQLERARLERDADGGDWDAWGSSSGSSDSESSCCGDHGSDTSASSCCGGRRSLSSSVRSAALRAPSSCASSDIESEPDLVTSGSSSASSAASSSSSRASPDQLLYVRYATGAVPTATKGVAGTAAYLRATAAAATAVRDGESSEFEFDSDSD